MNQIVILEVRSRLEQGNANKNISQLVTNNFYLHFLRIVSDYSFLPSSLVFILTYFSMSSTDEGFYPIFSYTKLFLVDLIPNSAQSVSYENKAIG